MCEVERSVFSQFPYLIRILESSLAPKFEWHLILSMHHLLFYDSAKGSGTAVQNPNISWSRSVPKICIMTIEPLMRLGWVQRHGQRVSEVCTDLLHPYKRCLNFQAQQARKEALKNWITESRESRLGSLKCKKAC